MSLKAKLEAVIYAAEEPVTLAQLAILFGDEALAWKADEEAALARQAAEAAGPVNEAFDYIEEAASEPATAIEAPAESAVAVEPEPVDDLELEGDEAGPDASEGQPLQPELDAVAEARRAARLRDREVRVILRKLLDEIVASYAQDSRGIEIREIAGGYRMATKPEFHDAVRAFVKSQKPPLKLSLPALETLAVVAYKQPVTAPEVNEIRGVDSSGVFGSLLARKLIATAGRKQVIGRPILYKTTKEFLLRFGLKDVTELPSMEEFEKMAAIELDEFAAPASEPAVPELDDDASEVAAEAPPAEAEEIHSEPDSAEPPPASAE
jgi:segregation and condensation protein B